MSEFKRKGDKARYSFKDSRCIGRTCWSPGMFQHRSPMSCGGSRNTGSPGMMFSGDEEYDDDVTSGIDHQPDDLEEYNRNEADDYRDED